MKRRIPFLLALMMALAMIAGCGGDNEKNLTGTVEQVHNVTEAPEEEEKVSLGRMEGGVYTNSYVGYGCELDESWTFYTAEELQELPANAAELFEDSELLDSEDMLSQITDMMAENVNDLTTINVNYTKLNMQERLVYAAMSHEDTVDTMLEQKDSLIATYEQAGFTVESMEKVMVTFLGQERAALHTSMTFEGIAYYTLQIQDFKVGQYGVTLTLASYVDDNTSALLELFYAVE